MKLTTQNCMSIMKIITKMGIKKDLIGLLKESVKIENKKESVVKEIRKTIEGEITEEALKKAFDENPNLAEKYNKENEALGSIGFELVFLIIEGVPAAEEDFYKLLAELKGTDINTEKGVEGADNFEFIKDLIQSESFQRFFQLVLK